MLLGDAIHRILANVSVGFLTPILIAFWGKKGAFIWDGAFIWERAFIRIDTVLVLTSLYLLLMILDGPFSIKSVVSKMSVFSPLSSEFKRLLLGFLTIFGNGVWKKTNTLFLFRLEVWCDQRLNQKSQINDIYSLHCLQDFNTLKLGFWITISLLGWGQLGWGGIMTSLTPTNHSHAKPRSIRKVHKSFWFSSRGVKNVHLL